MELTLDFLSWMYKGYLDERFGAMEWPWPRLMCTSLAKHHPVRMDVGLHRATSNCHLHCSLSLLCQGIIQDGKIIFMPNGFITQCPNLNRSKWHGGMSEFNITCLFLVSDRNIWKDMHRYIRLTLERAEAAEGLSVVTVTVSFKLEKGFSLFTKLQCEGKEGLVSGFCMLEQKDTFNVII